ncbi:hypothetical protein OE88DRAFT_1637825 [Heliocybe sulcata]|uniref:NAD(P)-binding domain-containing protein n=1 Tax=Heliocybe sulcata TaxID=5364 RepID=A0A5C3MQR4_9AGAM|nr:hypothetical protein OE88DRAFT_1637825 [Heliocybe sulcata]
MNIKNLNVLAIGASKNVGYHAATRLLDQGATVTFLLRSPSVFDNDENMKRYVASGKAKIVKGDALKREDVARAWQSANEGGAVDLLLFTLGGYPSFSLTKGLALDPPNLVTQAVLNTLTTIPTSIKPKIIAVTSNGLDQASHKALPLAMKPFYSFLLDGPHKDKLGAERLFAHCAGREWVEGEPLATILHPGWSTTEGLPEKGALADNIVVVRPAVYTNGSCQAEEGGRVRTSREIISGAYTVSRKDVAYFIVEGILKDWEHWKGSTACIAY